MCAGPLAQLVERHVYTVDVIGSSPVGPTRPQQFTARMSPRDKHRDGVNVSDLYPPTPGSGFNSTDDLYASLLGEIGLAGRVPSSVSPAPVEQDETPPAQDAGIADELRPDESGRDPELGGAEYPLAPEVSRSSFVAPTTDDARAYAASSEDGDPFDGTPVVADPSSAAAPYSTTPAMDAQRIDPPTGAFTSPAAQNALPDAALSVNGRPRPTFDEVLYGTAPGYSSHGR